MLDLFSGMVMATLTVTTVVLLALLGIIVWHAPRSVVALAMVTATSVYSWAWHVMPREEFLALNGLIFFLGWLGLIVASFWVEHPVEAAERRLYHWPFGSNERRWVILLGLTFVYFILCASVGRGQPLIRGVEEGLLGKLRQAESTQAYQQSQSVISTLGGKIWNGLELGDVAKAVGIQPAPQGPPRPPGYMRPFWGIRSWSHWFVFLFLYLPTLVIYGIAMRREEMEEWAREHRERLEERRRRRPAAPAPAGGEASLERRAGRSWWLRADVILDVFEVVGDAVRFFGRLFRSRA